MIGGARAGAKKEREKKEQRKRKDNAEAQCTQSRAESEKQTCRSCDPGLPAVAPFGYVHEWQLAFLFHDYSF
jgi:hypothetical protein